MVQVSILSYIFSNLFLALHTHMPVLPDKNLPRKGSGYIGGGVYRHMYSYLCISKCHADLEMEE